MSTLSFVKYQGAGNDFILIDDRTPFFDPAQVFHLCDRKFGIGADGVILLQLDPVADFRMRIFNSDGSEAESCGNGLRCLFRFILDLGMPVKLYRIATANHIVEASPHGDQVAIQMGAPERFYHRAHREHREREIYALDTGVPHVVVFVPDVQKVDVLREGANLRHDSYFQPRGTNVNFAEVQKDRIRIRTFERGVEGETMACGTGAAAVAVVASEKLGWLDPIRISCMGGELEFYVKNGLRMVGPAVKVFEGVYQMAKKESQLQNSLSCTNSMILAPVRARRKLTYSIDHRQFAPGPNPVAKARVWAEIGVLQLAQELDF